jgi:putative transposase
MVDIARKTKRYPTDQTDDKWRIEPLMPKPPRRGRKVKVDLREILNAIRSMARSGGGWRMLPTDFGPWQTSFLVVPALRAPSAGSDHPWRVFDDGPGANGPRGQPSDGVLDSQTVKVPHADTRGYDAIKKIVGRKRHIVADTDGRLPMVNHTTADISDGAGAQAILDAIRKPWSWLKRLFADGVYDRTKLLDKVAFHDFVLEIVRRTDAQKGFKV